MNRNNSLFAITTVVLLLCSCERTKQQGENNVPSLSVKEVRVGFRPSVIVDLAFLRYYSEGRFLQEGLSIRLVPFGRPDLLATAAENGEIDAVLGMPLETFLTASETKSLGKGYLWWHFAPDVPYDALVVPTDSDIRAFGDLQGRKVGSHPSKQVSQFVKLMAGPQATVKPYNAAAPFLTIRAKEVDAIYVLEPFVTEALADPGLQVIETSSISKNIFNGKRVPAALSLVTTGFLNRKPELAEVFVRAALAAYKELPDDQSWRPRVLGKKEFGGWDQARALKVKEPASSTPDEIDAAAFALFCEKLKEGGLISHEVVLDQIVYRVSAP